VLIDDEGNLRITDFGLSLVLLKDEILYDRTGTKPYMAPELHLASKSGKCGYSFAVDWCATRPSQGLYPHLLPQPTPTQPTPTQGL